MFAQPCFIRKNTPELRGKLEELGHRKHFLHLDEEPYLHTWTGISSGVAGYSSLPFDSVFVPNHPEYESYDCVDCGTNEDLFLALAALRDDSIKDHQWFVVTNASHISQMLKYDGIDDHLTNSRCGYIARKAAPAELIEHFNK